MADWIHKKNVKFEGLYTKLPQTIHSEYLLEISWDEVGKGKLSSTHYETIKIWDSKFIEEVLQLKEGKRERCCFAYGMQDIDLYVNNGTFAITHSPFSGLNIQYIFSDGELDKLVSCLKEPVYN